MGLPWTYPLKFLLLHVGNLQPSQAPNCLNCLTWAYPGPTLWNFYSCMLVTYSLLKHQTPCPGVTLASQHVYCTVCRFFIVKDSKSSSLMVHKKEHLSCTKSLLSTKSWQCFSSRKSWLSWWSEHLGLSRSPHGRWESHQKLCSWVGDVWKNQKTYNYFKPYMHVWTYGYIYNYIYIRYPK